jgi:hypothetical protein
MPIRLFRLSGIPDDEAQDVRRLLTDNGIDYYETPEGRWGIAAAAIWLRDEEQLSEARRLLDEYQRERAVRVRAEFEALRRQGRHETLFHRFLRDPIRFAAAAVLIGIVLYLMAIPFLYLR